MNHFEFRDGRLFAEEVRLQKIADEVGTPFFCYSAATLERHYDVMDAALSKVGVQICYAVKANSNQAVIKTFAARGSGADVVSEGELRRAMEAGVPAERIVFSGVGKTAAEMHFALEAGIGQFNVESIPELESLDAVATAAGKRAPVALRVNPDVDAQTHDKISTGRRADKFGIDIDVAPEIYARASNMAGIETVGLAVHIGSQLTSLDPFRAAFSRLAELVRELRGDGLSVARLDLGGGLGVVYRDEEPPAPEDYAAVIQETVGDLDVELTVEPGRVLVGNAGILVSSVIFVKETPVRRFVIVDAAMNDFIRPTLYDATHDVLCESAVADGTLSPADIVGPVCETGDVLAREAMVPPLQPGNLIALSTAGAYGAVMGSTYNTRLPTPEIMVKGTEFSIIRPRPAYSDMLSLDRLPSWL